MSEPRDWGEPMSWEEITELAERQSMTMNRSRDIDRLLATIQLLAQPEDFGKAVSRDYIITVHALLQNYD